jgi:hypothetical protein
LITRVWTVGVITEIALLALHVPFRITFTFAWVLMIFGFRFRETFAPKLKEQSNEGRDFFTFVGWFGLATFGVFVVAFWITRR